LFQDFGCQVQTCKGSRACNDSDDRFRHSKDAFEGFLKNPGESTQLGNWRQNGHTFPNLETGSWLKPQGKSREPRGHQTSKELACYGLHH
jgi:hypothetical protein